MSSHWLLGMINSKYDVNPCVRSGMCECMESCDQARRKHGEPTYEELCKALEFYANPETYFAIGFFPDPPYGEFIDDFSETYLGWKPGKAARNTLGYQ